MGKEYVKELLAFLQVADPDSRQTLDTKCHGSLYYVSRGGLRASAAIRTKIRGTVVMVKAMEVGEDGGGNWKKISAFIELEALWTKPLFLM